MRGSTKEDLIHNLVVFNFLFITYFTAAKYKHSSTVTNSKTLISPKFSNQISPVTTTYGTKAKRIRNIMT